MRSTSIPSQYLTETAGRSNGTASAFRACDSADQTSSSVFAISQLIEGQWSGSTKGAYTEGARREGKEFGGWRREIGAQLAVS